MEAKKATLKQGCKRAAKAKAKAKAKGGKAAAAAVTTIDERAVTKMPRADEWSDEMQLGRLEQFVRQLLSVERQSECAAVKAAIWIGAALNSARPLLRGRFAEWARDRFPEISATRQHYYRKISADFRDKCAGSIALPESGARSSGQALVALGFSREADKVVEQYVGERSLTELLYDIKVRVKPESGGFRPDVVKAADFIREKRPDLEGGRTEEWDAGTIRDFCAYSKATTVPADVARLEYEASKASFDHALSRLAHMVNGSTPMYQRLTGAECAEVARQLRAFADIVSRAGRRASRRNDNKI